MEEGPGAGGLLTFCSNEASDRVTDVLFVVCVRAAGEFFLRKKKKQTKHTTAVICAPANRGREREKIKYNFLLPLLHEFYRSRENIG